MSTPSPMRNQVACVIMAPPQFLFKWVSSLKCQNNDHDCFGCCNTPNDSVILLTRQRHKLRFLKDNTVLDIVRGCWEIVLWSVNCVKLCKKYFSISFGWQDYVNLKIRIKDFMIFIYAFTRRAEDGLKNILRWGL